ncbi:MAG: VWA domain-containing protein [Gemmatimonadales bacterium]|nr:MAG: VWA domain-containing protein [Gemmatimonadales bacterium]
MELRDLPSLAAALLALDARGVGGICIRGPTGPAVDGWLGFLRALLPGGTPVRKLPLGVTPDRLLGGPDLTATLAQGRRVIRGGVISETDGGLLLAPSMERITDEVAAALLAPLDHGEIHLEREGCSATLPARIAILGLDESRDEEEGPPRALLERTGIHLELNPRWTPPPVAPWIAAVDRVRRGMDDPPSEELVRTMAAAGVELGIPSLRPSHFALRAAGLIGRLKGTVDGDALGLAAALILLPRATRLPESPPDELPPEEVPPEEMDEPPPPPPPDELDEPEEEPPEEDSRQDEPEGEVEALPDQVVEAARAVLPPDWTPPASRGRTMRGRGTGRSGDETEDRARGRRKAVRPGDPRRRRVDLGATLRAAAPWQKVRGREPGQSLRIEAGDIQVQIRVRPLGGRSIFVVDASGSQAMRRLGEVKGAVELLLAESYRSREEVALVVFRDRNARVLVPPTRSLTRAKRLLRGLAGGGGTPMARGIERALELAMAGRRDGKACRILLLSDGRPNVNRQGLGGRRSAMDDALALAREVQRQQIPFVVLDTSPRGMDFLRELAGAAGGHAHHLPRADARRIRDRVTSEGWT